MKRKKSRGTLKTSAQALVEEAFRKSRRRREGQRELSEVSAHASPRNDTRPRVELTEWPVDRLHLPGRRVRRATASQLRRVESSFNEFGQIVPIIVRADGEIIDGAIRWELAVKRGEKTALVVVVDNLTNESFRKLRLTLNRLGETGEWDRDELAMELADLIDLGEDVVSAGFSRSEVDSLILGEEFDAGGPAEVIPPLQRVPISQMGDLWRLGDHLLLQGDSCSPLAYQRLLDGEQVRLLLTDIPYNVQIRGFVTQRAHREFAMASGEMSALEFGAFNRAWISCALPHMLDGSLLATFIDWRGVSRVLAAGEDLGLQLLNMCIWGKSNAGQGSLWRSQHELLPIFKVGTQPHVNNVELGKNGRWRSNLWLYEGGSTIGSETRANLQDHPTPKNRQMIEDAILDVTDRGEIVLDPFVGSGTSVVAAQVAGRRCFAIEIDSHYVDLTIRRWEALTGKRAVLIDTGESFADVERRRSDSEAVSRPPQRQVGRVIRLALPKPKGGGK